MRTQNLILSIAAIAGLLVASGCSKSEQAPPPPAPAEAPKAAVETPKPAAEAVKPVADAPAAPQPPAPAVAPAVDQAAPAATTTASAAAPAATSQIDGMIDKVKTLVKEEKYQDALKSVGDLQNSKLSTDQRSTVDKLKAEIQTLLAKKTTGSAIGDVLGGKK